MKKLTLLAKGLSSKGRKSGDTRLERRISPRPAKQASYIHRSGDENMLKMRFRTSSIATATKIKSSHALRNSSLNPSSLVISLLEFFGRLLLSCRLNRFVLFLSPKDYLTRIGCRMSTLRTKWTGQTIGFAKLSTNHFKILKIFSWCPFAARFSFWTRNHVVLPINLELAYVKSICGFCLPRPIQSHRTNQFNVKLLFTVQRASSYHLRSRRTLPLL